MQLQLNKGKVTDEGRYFCKITSTRNVLIFSKHKFYSHFFVRNQNFLKICAHAIMLFQFQLKKML